jgi:hypothetical protein
MPLLSQKPQRIILGQGLTQATKVHKGHQLPRERSASIRPRAVETRDVCAEADSSVQAASQPVAHVGWHQQRLILVTRHEIEGYRSAMRKPRKG